MGLVTSRGYGVYRASEAHVAFLDRHYRADHSRRGVIVCHGGGVGADWTLAQTTTPPPLCEAGYPLVACDFGKIPGDAPVAGVETDDGAWAFGNSHAIAAMNDAFTFLTTELGAKTDKVFLTGGSMGAATALQWARQYGLPDSKLLGAQLTIPALDLNDVRNNDRGGGPDSGYDKVTTSGNANSTGTTTVISIPSANGPVAVGSELVVFLGVRNATAGAYSAVDSKGNTWVVGCDSTGTGTRAVTLHAYIGTALAVGDTITITHPNFTTTTLGQRAWIVVTFSGGPTDSAQLFDGADADGSGSSTAPSAALTGLSSATIDIVVGVTAALSSGTDVYAQSPGWTSPATFSKKSPGSNLLLGIGYYVVTAGGNLTYAPTLSVSRAWAASARACKKLSGYRDEIDSAWGVTYPAALPAGASLSAVAAATPSQFAGLNARLYYSTNDTIIIPSTVTTFVSNLVAAGITSVSAISLGDVGHSAFGLDPYAAVRYFDSLGGRS